MPREVWQPASLMNWGTLATAARQTDLQAAALVRGVIVEARQMRGLRKRHLSTSINLMTGLYMDALHKRICSSFRAQQQQWALRQALTLPIFDGGRLSAPASSYRESRKK